MSRPSALTADVGHELSGASKTDKLAAVYELTKPRLNLLVLITTLVGYLAAAGFRDLPLLAHTLLGTALSAAGAGVLNQHVERIADGRMKRTRGRPLPTKTLTPGFALGLGVVLCVLGVAYLACSSTVWRPACRWQRS